MLADRLVILEDGAVTQIGAPEEIRRAPRTRYAAELVGVNAGARTSRTDRGGRGRLVASGGDGELVVPWPDWYSEGEVVGIVRPVDVTLWRSGPTDRRGTCSAAP